MSTIMQALRSLTAGNRPAPNTRQVGELFVNVPDRMLGVIDNTRTPVDLIAVPWFSQQASYAVGDMVRFLGDLYSAKVPVAANSPINPAEWDKLTNKAIPVIGTAPASPTTNDLWVDISTSPGQLKRWSGSGWVALTPATHTHTEYVPKTGGTFTGNIIIPNGTSGAHAMNRASSDARYLMNAPTIALLNTITPVDNIPGITIDTQGRVNNSLVISNTADNVAAIAIKGTNSTAKNVGVEWTSGDGSRAVSVSTGGTGKGQITLATGVVQVFGTGSLVIDLASIPGTQGKISLFGGSEPNLVPVHIVRNYHAATDAAILSYWGGSSVFKVAGNGNVQNQNNSYGAISDQRLKENIVDASSKLADLLRLRVVNFNLKNDPDPAKPKMLGLIAQEVEPIFPGLVETDPDTSMKSLKMSIFVPMLIKAVQELTARIEQLEVPK